MENPDYDKVLAYLAIASIQGRLGLFIGTGFSKAVLNNTKALSWGELLKKASEELNIDHESIFKEGMSYPEFATELCTRYSNKAGKDYDASKYDLKDKIAELTSYYPTTDNRRIYGLALSDTSPAWIITTNYDVIIEYLLTGKCRGLNPHNITTISRDIIPVFHLHGTRTDPQSIIITQEDYVGLFRPTEYRQMKLIQLLKEYTTLFIGYGLGDINVRTAVDWSKNVYVSDYPQSSNNLFQIVRGKNKSIIQDNSGIIIIKIAKLDEFFNDFTEVLKETKQKHDKQMNKVRKLANNLLNADDDEIESFINDGSYRLNMLSTLQEFESELISNFITFLALCLDKLWTKAKIPGNFKGYNSFLIILLDIIDSIKYQNMPPILFELLARSLEKVSFYIGNTMGNSFDAYNTWEERKGKIPKEMIKQLQIFTKNDDFSNLRKLLTDL